MCLAVPTKIVNIDTQKEYASVDYGDGTMRRANVSLVDVQVGDYVLIRAGFAIQTIDEEEAKATIDIFKEMISASEE